MRVDSTHPLAQTALACVIAQLRACLSQPLDERYVDFSLDALNSELVITARDTTSSGEIGRYRGVGRFGYGKAGLDKVLPYPILCHATYPTTFRLLKHWLEEEYNVLLEEGEFALSGAPAVPLTGDMPIADPPNAENSLIELIALETSGRWIAGTRLKLIVVGGVKKTHLNDQVQMPIAADLDRLTDVQHLQYYGR